MLNENQPQSTTPLANIPSKSERFWAMVAHLSFFLTFILFPPLEIIFAKLNLSLPIISEVVDVALFIFVVFLLGPFICILLYLKYKNRSRYIAFNSLQAMIFQLIFLALMGLAILILPPNSNEAGFVCLLPIICVWPLLAFIGGLLSIRGKDFDYPIIGKWITI